TQLGVPVATVWNRLHAALQTLRARLDAEHGDRRAWLLPLVPFATSPRALPWRDLAAPATKTLWLGAIVMTTKTKIVAALASVLVFAVAWLAWPEGHAPGNRELAPAPDAGPTVARGDLEPVRSAAAAPEEPTREAVDAPKVAATTGTLLVHARYAAEPTVAAGVTIHVTRSGGDFRVGLHRAITDAEGLARFDGLPPDTWRVGTPGRPTKGVKAEVAAGSTCECTLTLQGGMTVTGIVVDAGGVPIGGAIVEAAIAAHSGTDAEQVAVTAADGTFTIRACYDLYLIGARAEGHAASKLYYREGTAGSTEHVRIELRRDGGAVEGLVLAPTGEPVAGAVVRIGEGSTEGILHTVQGAPSLPAQVRTDAAGRFRAIGVPAGTQPVQVRTVQLAAWRGTCEVAAGTTVAVRIVLEPDITCTGIVRGEGGQPEPDADVSVGNIGDFVLLRTRSGADGTFTLTGLPAGDFAIAAKKDRAGKATARLHGQPGEPLRCELQLSNGLALRARVLDEAGAPVSQVEVRVEAEGEGARWTSAAFSGEDGRFVVGDCPPGRTLALRASKRDHVFLIRQAVQAGGPELELRLQRDTAAKARITGRLLRPDGSPAVGEDVEAHRLQTPTQAQLGVSAKVGDDGSFVIEAPAGEWHGRVFAKGRPEIRFEPGKLEAGATWDAGVLQLTVGGTLVVRVDGGAAKTDSYTVLDARERVVCSLWKPESPLRSDLIAPGDYLLLAQGEGVVAQTLPFTIHSGRETELAVTKQPGVRQWIEFELAPGTERPSYVAFQVRRGATLVASTHARGQPGAPFRREVWLAPGSYTLASHNREPQTTRTFTVGASEGEPLRIVLR
ncbi:MAG TPA: carboxypeptidase-like regulatory domain-containing protein, partial [Planctomycetota bacterium]|nr:carboxypeptidase-like regulatory domain-containing protein [Planctomycetota bacterium]